MAFVPNNWTKSLLLNLPWVRAAMIAYINSFKLVWNKHIAKGKKVYKIKFNTCISAVKPYMECKIFVTF